MSKTDSAAAPAAMDHKEDKEQAAVDKFERLFAEWLSARTKPTFPDRLETEDEANARLDRQDELSRTITTTPSPIGRLVLQKIEILEHCLYGEGEGTLHSDNREIVMLAGIKADLLQFDIVGRGESR